MGHSLETIRTSGAKAAVTNAWNISNWQKIPCQLRPDRPTKSVTNSWRTSIWIWAWYMLKYWLNIIEHKFYCYKMLPNVTEKFGFKSGRDFNSESLWNEQIFWVQARVQPQRSGLAEWRADDQINIGATRPPACAWSGLAPSRRSGIRTRGSSGSGCRKE